MIALAQKFHSLDRRASGLMLVGLIALTSLWIAFQPFAIKWGFSPLIFAIVIGIIAGNTVFPRVAVPCSAGVDFAKGSLLRLGIILFGFRITFQQIGSIGWAGALIDVIIITGTFILAVQLGTRLLKMDRETAMLVGIGSSICGAAAILAAEPVIRAQAQKVCVAVSTVVIFGTLGMFLYPLAFPYLGMSETAYGIYAGSTIHEVAQVVGAGKAISETAAQMAVIEKMLRVMMLAPFLLMLGIMTSGRGQADQPKQGIRVPGFALLFICAAGVNSLHIMPAVLVTWITHIDTLILAMAMAALGLRTHFSAFREAGPRPMLLAACLFLFLTVGGYFINRIVFSLFVQG